MPDPIFFTTPVGIAVIAAGSSFVAGLLGAFISSATIRATQRQRIEADEKLADRKFDSDQQLSSRRFEFDTDLAERKAKADIGLAERKIELDRMFAAWKRKTELAEEVLADFYEAREIFQSARSPGGFESEGKTRERESWEAEGDSRQLDSYFRTFERLSKKSEFFSRLYARRYRFLALFGQAATTPYDELFKIRAEITVAVRMLVMMYRQRSEGSLPQDFKAWETTIGWPHVIPDPIDVRLAAVIEAIERICRPTIETVSP